MNGIFHIMINGIAWCMFIVPWSFLILAVYRWKKLKRFRSHWILAPVVLTLMISIGSLILQPPTPSTRFKQFTKSKLPEVTKNLRYFFSGGGIADYHDEYYFETSPSEVDRLISEMQLSEGGGYSNAGAIKGSSLAKEDGPLKVKDWKGSKVFARNNRDTGWHYELRVNASRTKVYIVIGCI